MDAAEDHQLREIVRNTRRRSREAEKETRERERRARAFLPKLVQAFREIDPDIETIVLFGSLAEGTVRDRNFDIDIAVRSRRYLRLVAWALGQDFKIDVIDINDARPHIAERIRDRGEGPLCRAEGTLSS